MEQHVRKILEHIGEDPDREGLLDTPARVARAYQEICGGYAMDPDAIVQKALFTAEGKDMIVVKDVGFYSMCEHHMLPFFGKAAVGYIPNDKIVGLSKIGRVVEAYARRLQVQERMTIQIADCLMRNLDAMGVAVVLKAQHLCMMMRGVQKQTSLAVTSEMLGAFKNNAKTRAEFLRLMDEQI